MKLNSPGLSFHRPNLTQGWNTGNCSLSRIAVGPPGAVSERVRSGTPDILAVKSMLPEEMAERIRPDGAIVTFRDSMIST